MLAPNSITSLDQGKELARWHVERLYAEAGQGDEVTVPDNIAEPTPSHWHGFITLLAGAMPAMRRCSIAAWQERKVPERLSVS